MRHEARPTHAPYLMPHTTRSRHTKMLTITPMSDLFDAIRTGDEARVAALLDADATLLRQKEGNVSPLLFALYNGRRELARMFVERGAPLSFAEACAAGERARAEELLRDDPSALNRRSDDGFPPLGLAIFFGQPELARWLIEQGADVNAPAENAARVAPLHAAAAVCDRETMRLLLVRGADPNARQQMDFTPLHGAASRGDVEMAQMLLESGADADAKTGDGMTAIDVARKYGKDDCAEWLGRHQR